MLITSMIPWSVLASQPTPEQLLAIKPSPELQDRMSYLLSQNKEGQLSSLGLDYS